jgi:hypothetical protein
MFRSAFLIAALIIASFGLVHAEDVKSPAAVVTELYGAAGPDGRYQEPLTIFFDDTLKARYLSKKLRDAVADMEKRTPEGDVPNLDFDVVSDSQDPDVRGLKISTESESAERAVVAADFQSHEEKERTVLRYELVREGAAWVIDDVSASGKSHWRVSEIIAGKQ